MRVVSSKPLQRVGGNRTCPKPLRVHSSGDAIVTLKTPSSIRDVRLSLLEDDGLQPAELISVQLPAARSIAPLPPPVPVVHSKAFYIQTSQFQAEEASLPQLAGKKPTKAPSDNLLKVALRSLDEQLDEIERNPPPVQKALFEVSQGPVGQATAQGVQVAAKLTMRATMEAAKIAAPVGGWVLRQGAKTAFSLMTQAMAQESRSSTVKITKKGQRDGQRDMKRERQW